MIVSVLHRDGHPFAPLLIINVLWIAGFSFAQMTARYAKLGKTHIASTGDTAREMWNLMAGEKGRQQAAVVR